MDEVFAQPVVGLFPSTQLVCGGSSSKLLDFQTISAQVRSDPLTPLYEVED